ncbi:MAG: HWE histidine kinase domain-containing protein [Pseudomonadota bacterium]
MPKPTPDLCYSAFSPEEMEVGLQVARVGMGTVDYVGDTLRLDDLTAHLFDLPAGEDLPRDALHARIHPDDWPQIEAEVDTLLDPDKDDVLDMTHRILTPSGTIRWVNARKKVRFNRSGDAPRPISGIFAVVDITARVEAEHREKILIGELGHRAKNLYSVILSVARQLQRYSSEEAFSDRLIRRLEALARNQNAIIKGGDRHFALTEIIRQQLLPFEGATKTRVGIHGPSVSVAPDAAQIIAMITHELVTNAVKHGALSVPDGAVAITVTLDAAADRFVFRWHERGGPAVHPPSSQGFGTKVLTSLAEVSLQCEVRADYAPDGLVYDLSAPLSRICAAATT